MSKTEAVSEQKGRTNNPGGRPRISDDVKRLARKNSTRAIHTLVRLMESDDERVALQAANALLDRAIGKPSQHVEMDSNVTITNLHGWLASLGPVATADLALADQSGGVRDGDDGSAAGALASGGIEGTRH